MKLWRIFISIMMGGAITACASAPKPYGLTLTDIEQDRRVITYDLPPTKFGRMVVEVGMPDGQSTMMMLDTGATRSAVFASESTRLGLTRLPGTTVRIHGMVGSGVQPVTKVPEMRLQGTVLRDVTLAILKNPDREARQKELHSGILGMDILSKFHLYVDGPQRILRLIPVGVGTPRVPTDWRIVDLEGNPFTEDGRALHFMKIRLGNSLTPALLDTGSELNLMNWNTSRFPQLRSLRRRLRETWVIEGANGTFDPVSKIGVDGFRAGQKRWGKDSFVVLNFDSLGILGMGDDAFVILGATALKNERYVLDFANDRLSFAPTTDTQDRPGRRVMPTSRKRLK